MLSAHQQCLLHHQGAPVASSIEKQLFSTKREKLATTSFPASTSTSCRWGDGSCRRAAVDQEIVCLAETVTLASDQVEIVNSNTIAAAITQDGQDRCARSRYGHHCRDHQRRNGNGSSQPCNFIA